MGGQSYSNVTIDTANKVASWAGEVKVVPFLHAPGFCNLQAPGLGKKASFPSAAGSTSITVRARIVSESLTHFNVVLMTKGSARLFKQASYAANYTLTNEMQDVTIPLSRFECNWRGQPASWCPTIDTQLDQITNIGIGSVFPGEAGKFHVELESITATSA